GGTTRSESEDRCSSGRTSQGARQRMRLRSGLRNERRGASAASELAQSLCVRGAAAAAIASGVSSLARGAEALCHGLGGAGSVGVRRDRGHGNARVVAEHRTEERLGKRRRGARRGLPVVLGERRARSLEGAPAGELLDPPELPLVTRFER